MAGLPDKVIHRAREVLATLEEKDDTHHRELGSGDGQPAKRGDEDQFALFAPKKAEEDPIIGEIRQLDLMNLTPLDVMRAVDTWQRRLQGGKDSLSPS
jgi:DNA mismatch repair protein MutS